MGFISILKKDLQEEFFQFEENEMETFYNFLKKHNAYIVGRYITYLYLNKTKNLTNIYKNRIDIFISNKYIEDFLLNFYNDFSLIEQQFVSKYSTINDNILEIVYLFFDKDNNPKSIYLYVYQEDEGTIEQILKKYSNISLFEVWWNLKTDKLNIDKLKYDSNDKINGKVNNKYYDDFINGTGTTKSEYDFFEIYDETQIHIEPPVKSEPIILDYEDIEKEIIKTALIELTNYNLVPHIDFIISREKKTSSVINNDIYQKIYRNIYKSNFIRSGMKLPINYNEIYKYILNTLLIQKIKTFTFKNFVKAINEIYNPKLNISNIRNYFDEIIKEFFFNKYKIKLNIARFKIKFEFNGTSSELLTEDKENYIKQLLLFYYKNRLFDYKHKYKFENLIIHKFKLLDINLNISTDNETFKSTLTSKLKDIFLLFRKNKKSYKPTKEESIKILSHDKDITYQDIIFNDNIEDVENFLKEDDENIIIADPSRKNITGISKQSLDELLSNYSDNWFYDCNKFDNDDYLLEPYIKIVTSTITYYIPYQFIYSLFKSKNKLFFINPTTLKIEKTASYKNTPKGQREGISRYIGANHCQEGSYIELSTISTINEEIKTKKKTIEKRISLNKSITISSSQ